MSNNIFINGARLVWRHQRLLWWIFAVNFIIGGFTHHPVEGAFGAFTNHSMASKSLVENFDLGPFLELIQEKSIQLHVMWAFSMHMALIFLVFMIFIDGGVLTVYREDRKLPRAEFFEMSGAFFWRIVRLTLLSLIPIAICFGIFGAISGWSDTLSNDAPNAKTGFYVLVVGGILMWLVAQFVRLWFDVAQAMTVARNERSMLKMTWRGLVRSLRNIVTLLPTYAGIHLIGVALAALLLFVWSHTPHAAIGLNFVLLEVLLLIEMAVRLWQKAASMNWVEANSVVVSTPAYELAPSLIPPLPRTPDPLADNGPATPPPEV